MNHARARRAVEAYGCLAPLMLVLHEERTVTLSPSQRRHLVELCRTNARKNRALSKARRAAGDARGEGFYAGQALAYRRMAQRVDDLEGAPTATVAKHYGLNPTVRPV